MNLLPRLVICTVAAVTATIMTRPATAEGAQTDQPLLTGQQLDRASGEQVYRHICQACHMPDAGGATGAASYPALVGNPNVASAQYMATVILYGRGNMPSFMTRTDLFGFEAMTHVNLGDAEIAAVVNFVRSHFGNHYSDELTAADVTALHAAADVSR